MGNSSSSSPRFANLPASARTAPGTRSFQAISDNFQTLEQVQSALRQAGLESSNLIVAVDFTKSNEWTGQRSFGNRSLHWLGPEPNPYEQAISIIAKTLHAFDDDGLIPAYGFGDAASQDNSVFSFFPGESPAVGLDALVSRYRELVPYVKLAGPTSFAPAIYQAMKIVMESGGQYHILVIVADGQVTCPAGMPKGQFSVQEQATIDAIVAASNLPLSIVMVGVGDGPWDVMEEFDDNLPQRRWDNFQFVNFTAVSAQYRDQQRKEAVFAMKALMEIPDQYKIIQKLRLMGARGPLTQQVRCFPPPGPTYRPATAPPLPGAPHGGQPPHYGAVPHQYGAAAPPHGAPAPQYGAPPPLYAAQSSFQYGPPVPPYAAPPAMPQAPPAPPAAAQQMDSLFMCPITQEVMVDPVIAADGHTYDRESITQWLLHHDTSPMTNARLAHKNLTPNLALRSSIKEAASKAGRQSSIAGR